MHLYLYFVVKIFFFSFCRFSYITQLLSNEVTIMRRPLAHRHHVVCCCDDEYEWVWHNIWSLLPKGRIHSCRGVCPHAGPLMDHRSVQVLSGCQLLLAAGSKFVYPFVFLAQLEWEEVVTRAGYLRYHCENMLLLLWMWSRQQWSRSAWIQMSQSRWLCRRGSQKTKHRHLSRTTERRRGRRALSV